MGGGDRTGERCAGCSCGGARKTPRARKQRVASSYSSLCLSPPDAVRLGRSTASISVTCTCVPHTSPPPTMLAVVPPDEVTVEAVRVSLCPLSVVSVPW